MSRITSSVSNLRFIFSSQKVSEIERRLNERTGAPIERYPKELYVD
jgi:hypothetical protein